MQMNFKHVQYNIIEFYFIRAGFNVHLTHYSCTEIRTHICTLSLSLSDLDVLCFKVAILITEYNNVDCVICICNS